MLLAITKKIKTISSQICLFSWLTLASLLSFITHANIFDHPIHFHKLTTKNGLSYDFTYSIVEDHQGFIWIATQDGLNKFDGKSFQQYRHDNTRPNSLSDNLVRKVYIDSYKNLWVGTQKGLSKYNRVTDDFENFFHLKDDAKSLADNVIWDIYSDADKNLLVSTATGIHRFNYKESSFKRISSRDFKEKLINTKTIFQDNELNYWFGTYQNGLVKTDNQFKTLPLPNFLKEMNTSGFFDIQEFGNKLWFASKKGLYIYNELTAEHRVKLPGIEIRNITKVNEDEIMIGTVEGLFVLSASGEIIRSFKADAGQESLNSNDIMDILQTSDNKVWLSTLSGLHYFQLNNNLISNVDIEQELYVVESIVKQSDDKLMVYAVNQGIFELDFYGNKKEILSPGLDEGLFLISDNEECVFLITLSGFVYKYQDGGWSQINQGNRLSLDIIVTPIYHDSSIWFVNDAGKLSEFNLKELNVREYSFEERINYLVSGDNQTLYVMTDNQVLAFDHLESEFLQETSYAYDFSRFQFITSISISEKNIIWGTNSEGVFIHNKADNRLINLNESNGLLNSYINAVLADKNENLWISTNDGISYVDINTLQTKNFHADYGIENVEFLEGSSLILDDNHYYFGGVKGAFVFSPEQLLSSTQTINSPLLTDLFIANKRVLVNVPDGNGLIKIKQHINELKEVTLTHNDSPFSIEFISPNNTLAEQVAYRYRLLGLDERWIDAGPDNRRATYTNLSAGLYTLEVEAYDLYQPKMVKSKSINIKILPPWWLSNSAIVFYCIMGLLLIGYFIQQLRYKHQYNMQIQQSEERLKLSLWGSGDEMWDWNIDTGKIYRSNIWGILEFPQDGERNIGAEQTNLHPSDLSRVRECLKRHFDGETEHFEVTYRVKDKNENWIWVLDRGKIVERDENNEPTRMTGTLKDISLVKQAEERLKLFAKCVENISDAIVIYDRQFVVVDVNQAFESLTGKTKREMVGTSMKFSQYSERFNLDVKKHLLTKGRWHGEIESKRQNGDNYITDLNIDLIRDEHGKISHFVGVFSDITERKKNESELRKLANSDTLTGLPNRSYFQANQQQLVKSKTPHALLVFDLDNFKKINDSMGHEVGDILLCKVAERILSLGRSQDTVYRLGGDEFSMIIENTNDIHTITSIAKDILRAIAQPLKLKNQEVVLYSSIGIVLYPEDGVNSHELLKNADTAMYHAKGQGGNKYQFFNESMNKQAVKRLQIENLIRHGLKEDYFSVFYQPKIHIATGKISGMEALVRFETPTKGIISPGVFISSI